MFANFLKYTAKAALEESCSTKNESIEHMKYTKKFVAKNGKEIIIRNAESADGEAVLENFNLTHTETDFLLTYPDESSFTAELESRFLGRKAESANEAELVAVFDGKIVGTAGIDAVGTKYKVAHRAEFGVSVLKDYWGLSIGKALTEACIECARSAGYVQLELSVVSDNKRAVSLYKSLGFSEYGRNPTGFKSRTGSYQELVYMMLEL